MSTKRGSGLTMAFVVTTAFGSAACKTSNPPPPRFDTAPQPIVEPAPSANPGANPGAPSAPLPLPPAPAAPPKAKSWIDIIMRSDGSCVQREQLPPPPCPPGAACAEFEPTIVTVQCPEVPDNVRLTKRGDGICEYYASNYKCPTGPPDDLRSCNPPAPQRVILPCP